MISVLSLAAALPNWPIMLPFVILLVAIALAPLIAQRHWERHYHKLCVAVAGIVCFYYLFIVKPVRARRSRGNRLCDLHGHRRFFLRYRRRNSFARQIAKRRDEKHSVPLCRGALGQSNRHHRRIDAADPAVDRDEQRPRRADAYRVLCFSGQQHRRRAVARGPAADPGISQRRAVWLDAAKLLAPMADHGRDCSGRLFCARSCQSSRAQKGHS